MLRLLFLDVTNDNVTLWQCDMIIKFSGEKNQILLSTIKSEMFLRYTSLIYLAYFALFNCQVRKSGPCGIAHRSLVSGLGSLIDNLVDRDFDEWIDKLSHELVVKIDFLPFIWTR